MTASAAEAASAAVERMRTAREQAQRRRQASRAAVEQLRERNREECERLVERARHARHGQQQWPGNRQPREMHLYDEDDETAPAATPPGAPQRPPGQRSQTDDDWSQESWLH